MERDQRPDAEDDDEHDEQADREPISEISGYCSTFEIQTCGHSAPAGHLKIKLAPSTRRSMPNDKY